MAIQHLEFDDVIKVRKSLLISSLIGLFFKQMINFSSGDFEFFGFKVINLDATFIPNFIGGIIIFFMVVFGIRIMNDRFKEKYTAKINWIDSTNFHNVEFIAKTAQQIFKEKLLQAYDDEVKMEMTFNKRAIIFLDLWFPIIFAIIVLCNIYFDIFNFYIYGKCLP
ncbi:hypothetical protein [Gaetbulibacter saemankumensis]|uniref:hypothetical protein n=1 Tax=Gaetbulibacter saemankumensis TaxID=311208 RepID=UPI00040545F5|nr:hypothetical protein [Gaetbulibacter saemankumensis]